MQNRYIADIGDYLKFAILRELSPGRRLGVLWWLFADEDHNRDGGHREYLERPKEWRHFDPELFDTLYKIDEGKQHNVHSIENSSILPRAAFVSDQIPYTCLPFSRRPEERIRWFQRAKALVLNCNLLFLDPDNGIASDKLRLTCRRAGKCVTIKELQELTEQNCAIVVYHHQTRYPGGHFQEIENLRNRLKDAGLRTTAVLRAKPWSPRLFFILNGDGELLERAERIAQSWPDRISLC